MEECYRTGRATDDNIIQHMCLTCWITKATNTHSECVILVAFPWQHWLHKRASLLYYTYIACLASTSVHHEDILQGQTVVPLKTKISLHFI
jgi:hypothetical protein